MPDWLERVLSTLIGDHRHYSIERRLFNTISLLNAAANIGGAVAALMYQADRFLFLLHLGTGVLFGVFYYLSRFKDAYRVLYWPFLSVILAFLFINSLFNAGSAGGAHYYFIPALVIGIILSAKARRAIVTFLAFGVTTAALFIVEQHHPDWITQYASPLERMLDVRSNFLFVQLLTGILVVVLIKNLNQERAKSDSLLLNILPASVAEELKANDAVSPRHYESASVLFTDFVGFTQIAEGMTPDELITELDACFSRFDAIARQHKMEKIKTIGDSYMAVGGVPSANRTHAVDSVLTALEIQRFMMAVAEKKKMLNKPCWQLRLGIHTGRLVAGVVGREKFAYDVWGDTVNTASRLESSGLAGRINISGATYELVKDLFVCEYRGKISAKHKGEIDMYFVNAIQPLLSQESGEPNQRFIERCNALNVRSSSPA
ncbi:MAG: adenylate/guanylate cyclase domain-containing protein [Blastocatellia bacterium]